eukprot:COSAG01_NODE_90_length_27307_cov_734.166458_16_plen_257_part_00
MLRAQGYDTTAFESVAPPKTNTMREAGVIDACGDDALVQRYVDAAPASHGARFLAIGARTLNCRIALRAQLELAVAAAKETQRKEKDKRDGVKNRATAVQELRSKKQPTSYTAQDYRQLCMYKINHVPATEQADLRPKGGFSSMKGSEPAEMYEKLKGYSSPDEDGEEDATPDPLLFSGSEDVYRLSEADGCVEPSLRVRVPGLITWRPSPRSESGSLTFLSAGRAAAGRARSARPPGRPSRILLTASCWLLVEEL